MKAKALGLQPTHLFCRVYEQVTMCTQELKASPSSSLVLHLHSNPSPATNHCSSLGTGHFQGHRCPGGPHLSLPRTRPSAPRAGSRNASGLLAGAERRLGAQPHPQRGTLEPQPKSPRRLPDKRCSRPDTERVFRRQNRHRTQSTKSDVLLTNIHVSYFPQGSTFKI